MNLDNQLLFFFSALGAFNSVLLSIYFLFFAKPKSLSNYFLGGLLAVLSIRIWKSLFFYFNPELSKTYLQIGLSACFFIGPFLYFYIQSFKPSTPQKRRWIYLQLLSLMVLAVVVGMIYPYEKYTTLWGSYFYKVINYQWLAFILLTAFKLNDVFRKLILKKGKLSEKEVWKLSIFSGVFLIWFAYFTASYTSYILGALSFTLAMYISGLLIFYKRKNTSKNNPSKGKYSNSKIEEEEAQMYLQKIQNVLRSEELYKNPNLTLSQLAKEVNMRPHLLSQLLNDNLKKSFPQFINEYRIEEAKQLLSEKSNLKMEVIAEDCGFNSNSTFYAAFKKVTGTTPAKYANR